MQISKDLVALVLSIGSATVLIATTFGGMKTTVEAQSQQINNAVTQKEFSLYMQTNEKRLDKIEVKVDKVIDILDNRRNK